MYFNVYCLRIHQLMLTMEAIHRITGLAVKVLKLPGPTYLDLKAAHDVR